MTEPTDDLTGYDAELRDAEVHARASTGPGCVTCGETWPCPTALAGAPA